MNLMVGAKIFRRPMGYEQDSSEREAASGQGLGGRLSRWLARPR